MNRNRALALIVAAIFMSAALCLDHSLAGAITSPASTITVINTNDNGPGSLRQALLDAQSGDMITFNLAWPTTIALTSGELVIDKNIHISGPGANLLAVSRVQGAAEFRIFHITSNNTVSIQGVAISNGVAPQFGPGGGILVEGNATLGVEATTISGNSTGGTGGGVSSSGTLFIDSSTVRDNSAGDYGGGIDSSGTLYVNDSTLSNNRGEFAAGAILNGGSLTMNMSTISGNTTQLHGGGLGNCCSASSHAVVNYCTFSGNSGSNGGAIYNRLGSLEIKSAVLKRGSAGPNISNDSATLTSLGYNLSDDNGSGLLTGTGDQINIDPLLGPLQDNGGLTFTHALSPGSPAINAGDPNLGPPPDFDQRGPDFWRFAGGRIDVGSFEVQSSSSPTPTPIPTPTPTPSPIPSLSPLPTPSPPCLGGSAFWSHFSNTEPIAPADRSSNDPGTSPGLPANYPSIVHVTGIIPPIADPNTCGLVGMAVTFTLTSERPDDLDILLVAPNGSRSIIVSDAGGNGPITNSGYLFRSHYLAGFPLFPDELTPPPGYYGEANYIGLSGPEPGGMDNFPEAGGLANYPSDLNQLLGAGYSWPAEWRLYVVDDETGNISSLPQGWRLSFLWECSPCATPVPTPTPPAPTPTPSPSPTASPSDRTSFDYDGDGRADQSVFRSAEANWYLLRSRDGFAAANFGLPTDKIVPADFDGDGKTDIAVYRPGNPGVWYWLNSTDGSFHAYPVGAGEFYLTPADYDGDGKADLSGFEPTSGNWFHVNSSNGQLVTANFGTGGDRPTIGDYDGDGKSDLAVWRPSNGVWYRLNSLNGAFVAVGFGLSTDLTTPADLDGDGKTDIAVYRRSSGVWYWLNSSNGAFNAAQFGIAEDIPTPADYDGDGKADICVFRPSDGVWYRLNSGDGQFVAVQFGASGDRPIPAAFRY